MRPSSPNVMAVPRSPPLQRSRREELQYRPGRRYRPTARKNATRDGPSSTRRATRETRARHTRLPTQTLAASISIAIKTVRPVIIVCRTS